MVISACGASEAVVAQNPEQLAAAGALGSEVAVSFNRNWTVTRSSDLFVGSTLRVSYDTQRLPDCRQEQAGQPLWSITGFWSLAGQSGTFEAGGASPTNPTLRPSSPSIEPGNSRCGFRCTTVRAAWRGIGLRPQLPLRGSPGRPDHCVLSRRAGRAECHHRRRARRGDRVQPGAPAQLSPGLQRHADLGHRALVPLRWRPYLVCPHDPHRRVPPNG